MRQQGTVVRWESAKGFGFIRAAGMQDVFFHVQEFRPAPRATPQVGMKVDFESIHVGGKGPRAMAVQPVGWVAPDTVARQAPRTRRPSRRAAPALGSGARVALPLMIGYAALLLWAVWHKHLPVWILAASAGLNVATFFAYWHDKYAAEQGRWRTPESTLHTWSLVGGWGGGWVAQQLLRHKSNKASFVQVYWFTTLLHCAAAGYSVYRLSA